MFISKVRVFKEDITNFGMFNFWRVRGFFLKIVKAKLVKGNLIWIIKQMFKYIYIRIADYLGISPLTGPIMGGIVVTYRCNYQCPMCNVAGKKSERKEFNTQEMIEVIDDFYGLGIAGLAFVGGEPLLRGDIGILIRYAKYSRGMVVILNTNGHLLSKEEVVDDLLDFPPDNINISLDSDRSYIHDKLRGCPGSFSIVTEGVEKLVFKRNKKKAKCIITLVTVLCRENIEDIESIYSLGRKLNVDHLGFIPLHIFNQGVSSYLDNDFRKRIESAVNFLISKKEEGSKPLIENSVKYLRMFSLALTGQKLPLKCTAGYTSYFVDTYGDVFGCWPYVELGKTVGNIKKQSMSDLWQSDEYNRLRKTMKNCRGCFWNCQTELNLLFNKIEKISKVN